MQRLTSWDIPFEDHHNWSEGMTKGATYDLQFDFIEGFVESFICFGYNFLQPLSSVGKCLGIMQGTVPEDLSSLHELYDVNQAIYDQNSALGITYDKVDHGGKHLERVVWGLQIRHLDGNV